MKQIRHDCELIPLLLRYPHDPEPLPIVFHRTLLINLAPTSTRQVPNSAQQCPSEPNEHPIDTLEYPTCSRRVPGLYILHFMNWQPPDLDAPPRQDRSPPT